MRHHKLLLIPAICAGLLAMTQALGATPSNPADTKFSTGDFDQAFSLYLGTHQHDPKDVHALVRLGEIDLFSNRLNDATHFFEAAVALDSSNKRARNGLLSIMDRTGANGTFHVEPGTHATTVPFVATDPLPIIKVRINGQRDAYFLIDTGAPGVVLDPDLAKALHLNVTSAGQGVFAGGQQAAVMQSTIDTIVLSGVVVKHVPVTVMPMAGAPAPSGIHLDGIVGTSLFYHFLSTLDYVHGRLILAPRSDSSQFEKSAKQHGDSIVPLWYVPDHFLFAKAKVNGIEGLFNVDTGGDLVGVQVSKSMLEKSKITLDQSHKSHMAGPGGDVEIVPFKASVTVGTTTVKSIPGVYMPGGNQYGIFPFAVDGTISHKFFRAQVVTFDFVAMQMVIAKQ
jgi:hypothetical protein